MLPLLFPSFSAKRYVVFFVSLVAFGLLLGGDAARAQTTRRLFFVSDRDGNREIYSSAPDGSDARNLTQSSGDDRDPALSPDGKRLAWTRDGNLWAMNPDGTQPQQITSGGGDSAPSWTPNGTQIVFARRVDGKNQVFAVQPDAGAPTRLFSSTGNEDSPLLADLPGGESSSHTLAAPQATPVPVQPQVVSLSPDSAIDSAGATRTWKITVRDDSGVGDLASIWFMASRTFDWNAGITFVYTVQSNQLWVRDNGTWSGPIVLGNGTLETARVSLDGAGVLVAPGDDGKTLTLTLSMRVKAPMSGVNSLWARVENASGMVDAKAGPLGFVSHGTWSVNVGDLNQSPLAVVHPGERGQVRQLAQGVEAEVTLDLTDGDGAGDIESGWLEVGPSLDWGQGMTLYYDAAGGRLYLRSTGGAAWLGGEVVGQGAGTLENDAGSIRLEGCAVSPLADGLRLHLPLTPKAALVGTQQVWTHVADHEGHIASDADSPFGFSLDGTWQVGRAPAMVGWGTSFSPIGRSALAAPVDYSAWDGAKNRINPVFDWKGGLPEQAGAGSSGVRRHIGHAEDPNTLAMEFQTDAPQWELLCNQGAGTWRVLVRDADATTWQVLGEWKLPDASASWAQLFRQGEGVRSLRRWRVEYSNQLALGLRLNAGETISAAPANPPRLRVLWCGDSFVEGVGGNATWQGFAAQAGALLNVDSQFDASGGTGYLNNGAPGAGKSAFGDRLDNIVQADPAVVVIYGSTNDANYAPADVAAAARKFWMALHQALPNAKIIVIGPVQPSDYWHLGALSAALQNAATQSNIPFVDATSWINGTGNVAAGRGDGNADAYTSADGIHPTPAGHAYLASKVADALRPLLGDGG